MAAGKGVSAYPKIGKGGLPTSRNKPKATARAAAPSAADYLTHLSTMGEQSVPGPAAAVPRPFNIAEQLTQMSLAPLANATPQSAALRYLATLNTPAPAAAPGGGGGGGGGTAVGAGDVAPDGTGLNDPLYLAARSQTNHQYDAQAELLKRLYAGSQTALGASGTQLSDALKALGGQTQAAQQQVATNIQGTQAAGASATDAAYQSLLRDLHTQGAGTGALQTENANAVAGQSDQANRQNALLAQLGQITNADLASRQGNAASLLQNEGAQLDRVNATQTSAIEQGRASDLGKLQLSQLQAIQQAQLQAQKDAAAEARAAARGGGGGRGGSGSGGLLTPFQTLGLAGKIGKEHAGVNAQSLLGKYRNDGKVLNVNGTPTKVGGTTRGGNQILNGFADFLSQNPSATYQQASKAAVALAKAKGLKGHGVDTNKLRDVYAAYQQQLAQSNVTSDAAAALGLYGP